MLYSRCKVLFVLLVGCSGGAKYPEGSQSIYCTNLIDDCDQQAAQHCPGGYKVLHKENWSSNLAVGGVGRGGAGREDRVRHSSIRIACDPVSDTHSSAR